MHKKLIALVVILACLIAPAMGFAASPWMDNKTYAEQTSGKLGFGLTNVLLGWMDIFYEPYKADKNGKSVLGGIGKGLVDAIANEVGGAVHFVTFLIPVDVPLPDNGVSFNE